MRKKKKDNQIIVPYEYAIDFLALSCSKAILSMFKNFLKYIPSNDATILLLELLGECIERSSDKYHDPHYEFHKPEDEIDSKGYFCFDKNKIKEITGFSSNKQNRLIKLLESLDLVYTKGVNLYKINIEKIYEFVGDDDETNIC